MITFFLIQTKHDYKFPTSKRFNFFVFFFFLKIVFYQKTYNSLKIHEKRLDKQVPSILMNANALS